MATGHFSRNVHRRAPPIANVRRSREIYALPPLWRLVFRHATE